MRRRIAGAVLVLAGMLVACPALGSSWSFSQDPAVVSGDTATIEVRLLTPLETIEAFDISVGLSDPALLTPAPNLFSRFSFALSPGLVAQGWIGAFGFDTTIGAGFYEASLTPPFNYLAPSATPYDLGTLSIDLTGLTLSGSDLDGMVVTSDSVAVPVSAVPEPLTMAAVFASLTGLTGYLRKRLSHTA